ncbi:MAG: DUF2020 domain-containing protein [Pseudonocardiaceae bacterium]
MSSPHRFIRAGGAVAGGLLFAALAACGSRADLPGGVAPPTQPASVTPPTAVAPPEPQPSADGPCPYLDRKVVERINGQRVGAVRVSTDRPHPACFFYRLGDGAEQLRTWVVVATPAVAGATVDAAAPVATSDREDLPGGWTGGSQPTSHGAVFAVTRQGTAVVVTTNQRYTVGARQIAEQVIAALDR